MAWHGRHGMRVGRSDHTDHAILRVLIHTSTADQDAEQRCGVPIVSIWRRAQSVES